MFKFGIEKLFADKDLMAELKSKKVALLAHPASVDQNLDHSIDLCFKNGIELSSCFGPQHGMKGEKQDNMIESDDYKDPKYNIPVFSLYGEYRKPTDEMMNTFDIMLVDLQDVGNRIYTYIATLVYIMDACERLGKEVIVLDRPNPAGRGIEGLTLNMDFETFVGSVPMPMRNGITLGELALWYKAHKSYQQNVRVVPCENYNMSESSWPKCLSWVNPSPNLPRLTGIYSYAGTVLIEGATVSEGRGTTIPLELFGAPDVDGEAIVKKMYSLNESWLKGCKLRPCFFEPTFQKHTKKLCSGFQIHVDHPVYKESEFSPFRLVSLAFKAVRELYSDYNLWNQPPYEYEKKLMPIDILSGSSILREWVDDKTSKVSDLDKIMKKDEQSWLQESKEFYLYK